MKKQNYVLMTVFLILFWGGHILPGQNVSAIAGAIDTKLTESLDFFKEGKVSKGAGMLLDVVLLTRPRSSWPDGFVQHLNLARDHFNRGSYTEGVSYILLAKKTLRSDAGKRLRGIRIAPVAKHV